MPISLEHCKELDDIRRPYVRCCSTAKSTTPALSGVDAFNDGGQGSSQ